MSSDDREAGFTFAALIVTGCVVGACLVIIACYVAEMFP